MLRESKIKSQYTALNQKNKQHEGPEKLLSTLSKMNLAHPSQSFFLQERMLFLSFVQLSSQDQGKKKKKESNFTYIAVYP